MLLKLGWLLSRAEERFTREEEAMYNVWVDVVMAHAVVRECAC